MMFNKFALLALFAPAAVFAAEGSYSYDDTKDNGPSNWGNLPIQGNQCGLSRNSGIPLSASGCEHFEAAYEFDGGDCSLDDMDFKTVDNGVKAFFPNSHICKANRMKIPNVDGIYQAAQYHIHVGTEHKFEGNSYDFELHIVHAKVSGSGSSTFPDGVGGTNPFAVYGFPIQAGAPHDNPKFQEMLNKWVASQNAKVASCSHRRLEATSNNLRKLVTAFDIYSLVDDADKDFFHYGGGLTTPPCTEAVWFNMAQKPIKISDHQAMTLKNIILDYRNDDCELATKANPVTGSTARPVQPRNNRDVQLICSGESALGTDLYLDLGPVDVSVDDLEAIVAIDVGGVVGGLGGLLGGGH